MQRDNVYTFQKATLGDPEVSAICDAILRVTIRFRACVFSLIDLAHEHNIIYRVCASDNIQVVYPIRGRTRQPSICGDAHG